MSPIYFIQPEEGGLMKIGFANDPTRRLRELQTGSPLRLRLVAEVPGTIEDERALHRHFRHLRERHEWFRPVPELRVYLARQLGAAPEGFKLEGAPRAVCVICGGHSDLHRGWDQHPVCRSCAYYALFGWDRPEWGADRSTVEGWRFDLCDQLEREAGRMIKREHAWLADRLSPPPNEAARAMGTAIDGRATPASIGRAATGGPGAAARADLTREALPEERARAPKQLAAAGAARAISGPERRSRT